MSTNIIGFRPPDEKWTQMKAIWDTCKAADVPVPKSVEEFFNYCEPDDNGVEIDLQESIATEWSDGDSCAQGFEIKVADLPTNITIIRFYNAW